MNSENLKTFVTVVETESYTKAAQLMLVVQSTISKRIRELETEVGKELILRDKKQITPTPAGRIFLQYARKILELEDNCLKEIEQGSNYQGILRIGCVQTLFETHVSGLASGFSMQHKNIFLHFDTRSSQNLLNDLYDGNLDVCFSYRKFNEKNYRCIPFLQDEMILVTGCGNSSFPEGITDAQLAELPLVHENLTCVSDAYYWLQEIFQNNKNPQMYVGTGSYAIPLIKSGNGYGFVVKKLVEKELLSGELKQIHLLEHDNPMLQSYLIYRDVAQPQKDCFLSYLNLSE